MWGQHVEWQFYPLSGDGTWNDSAADHMNIQRNYMWNQQLSK